MGNFLGSSIGKKILMSLSGLIFIGFLVGHLAGNLLLYVGKEAFNAYTNGLLASGIVIPTEIVLTLALIIHVYTSIKLTLENKKARPQAYKVDVSAGKRTWMSSHMAHSGMIILIFVILHLVSFKFGDWSHDPVDITKAGNLTLYDLVVERFGTLYYSVFYVIAMIFISFHLNHAFQSAFQTLGINHLRYTPVIKKLGTLYSIVVPLAFASMPIYFYLKQL